jgi:hypothetical protein
MSFAKRISLLLLVLAAVLFYAVMFGPQDAQTLAEMRCLEKRNGIYLLDGDARLACLQRARGQ